MPDFIPSPGGDQPETGAPELPGPELPAPAPDQPEIQAPKPNEEKERPQGPTIIPVEEPEIKEP